MLQQNQYLIFGDPIIYYGSDQFEEEIDEEENNTHSSYFEITPIIQSKENIGLIFLWPK